MKQLKKLVILGVLLLIGFNSAAQDEYQKDSIWGVSIDSLGTDLLLDFSFSVDTVNRSERYNKEWNFDVKIHYNNGEYDAFAIIIYNRNPINWYSKTVKVLSVTYNGHYYDVKMKFDTDNYLPENPLYPWTKLTISANGYEASYYHLSNTSHSDNIFNNNQTIYHKYYSLNGIELKNITDSHFYIDCSYNDGFIEYKKCVVK